VCLKKFGGVAGDEWVGRYSGEDLLAAYRYTMVVPAIVISLKYLSDVYFEGGYCMD
jgi:hypothetical protein